MINIANISATSVEDRSVLMKLSKDRSLCIDVGTFLGGTALTMLHAGVGHVVTIDSFDGKSGGPVVKSWPKQQLIYEAINNLSDFSSDDYTLIVGDSLNIAKMFAPASIDLVFLDGAHDYNSVRKDIDAWLPLVAKGGILAGHDYEMSSEQADKYCIEHHYMYDDCPMHGLHPGVIRAVDKKFGLRANNEARVWWVNC